MARVGSSVRADDKGEDMVRTCTRALCRAMIAGMLLAGAALSSAGAEEGSLSPAGEASLVSEGGVTFEAAGVSVACNLTLDGSLMEGPIAMTEGEPIGDIAGIEWSECSGGGLRASLGLEWDVVIDELETSPSAVLRVTVVDLEFQLSTFGGFVNCLYSGDVQLELPLVGTNPYDLEDAGVSGATLARVSGAFCPSTGALTGTFELAPQQELQVPPIVVECRGAEGTPVNFGTVAPGNSATRRVTCKYVEGNPVIRVAAGTGIIGGIDAEAFSAEGIPAAGTALAAGESAAIRLRFEPPAAEEPPDAYVADFRFATTHATVDTPLVGTVP